jgi:hypothetical protein
MKHQRSPEELYATQIRGIAAKTSLDAISDALTMRRDELIRTAINNYESTLKKYTGEDALLFVAALAENRRLLNDLQFVERKGRQAGKELLASTRA